MHYLKVKAGRPVRVFFAEEIHKTNISLMQQAQSNCALLFNNTTGEFGFSTK
jgi:hypothetical protein